MKNFMLRIVALAALSAGLLLAQDITGTWQGTLPGTVQSGGKDLRTVVKISKADDGGLKALLYSIDQMVGGQGLATIVTLQGSTVKFSVPGIAVSYEGQLDGDGSSITGTWTRTRGAGPQPLNLKHVANETAWAIPEPPARPKPMGADAIPVFEVATVKPSKPDALGKGFGAAGRQFSTNNTSVSDIITFSYGLHPRQIIGGPSWLESDRYDISAKPDGEGQPSEVQWKAMIQKLLADRFQLTFHREKRELSAYAIVVAKGGPKLTKSAGDPSGLPELSLRGLGVLTARNANIGDLAGNMQQGVLDRPVIDETELPGRYDFTLTWTPDEFQFGGLGIKVPPATDNAGAPDLYAAIQQQLGLKLGSTKAAVEVLVIDHVERPSEN